MFASIDSEQQAKLASKARQHPWTVTTNTEGGRYVNFRKCPELISSSLEDLKYIAGQPLAATVIEFIEWANGPDSVFETNDFGCRPIHENMSPEICPKQLQASFRITVLFRDLALNTDEALTRAFSNCVLKELQAVDRTFREAVWSCNTWPHEFTDLSSAGLKATGVCFSFIGWAFGDTPAEAYGNADRALRNLQRALEAAAKTVLPAAPAS